MIARTKEFSRQKIDSFLSVAKASIPLWVLGTEELSHQTGLIKTFEHLSSSSTLFSEASASLSLLAWQQNPLNYSAAKYCMELNHSLFTEKTCSFLNELIEATKSEIPTHDIETLLSAGDKALIIRHLFPYYGEITVWYGWHIHGTHFCGLEMLNWQKMRLILCSGMRI